MIPVAAVLLLIQLARRRPQDLQPPSAGKYNFEVLTMKYPKWAMAKRMGAVGLLFIVSQAASAAMTANEYACKVVTIGGQQGVVLVQADTKALAKGAAAGAQAFTFDNGRVTATSVVECIDRRKERFSDYQFQQFFESIPL
jgi:hypothetical protein